MLEVVKSVIEKDGKYLLIKRASTAKFFPEMWDFIGGKIEPNESVLDAAKREVFEETSLKIEINKLEKDFVYTENNIEIHFRVFSTNSFFGTVKLSNEHTDHMWISKEEMVSYNLAPVIKVYFGL